MYDVASKSFFSFLMCTVRLQIRFDDFAKKKMQIFLFYFFFFRRSAAAQSRLNSYETESHRYFLKIPSDCRQYLIRYEGNLLFLSSLLAKNFVDSNYD